MKQTTVYVRFQNMSETGYGVDLENGYGFSFFPAYP